MNLLSLPNLDSLIGLARKEGVDVRPILVRVLTDLYVQKREHTREEEHQFTELALWLLAGVDVPTRAAAAQKLARYPAAPRLVVRRLARDVFEVAEPVLRHSPCLTSDDLLAVIKDFGPRHAAAIGQRNRSAAAPAAEADEASPGVSIVEPESGGALAAAESAAAEAADTPSESEDVRHPPVACPAEPTPIGAYFLAASSSERRLLIANLQDGTLTPSERALVAAGGEAVRALEAAALQRRPQEFIGLLEQVLGISEEAARRIVHDETGEPLLVAVKAIGMPADTLLRILLFLNPVIGHSVERVFALADLYEELSEESALHLLSSLRRSHPAVAHTPRHQPYLVDDEARGARGTRADHPRRALFRAQEERHPSDQHNEAAPRERVYSTS